MTVRSIRVHDTDNDGVGLYGYGEGGGVTINSTNGMKQSASHIFDSSNGWTVSGTDMTEIGFSATPPAQFDGDNAEIVNSGVYEVRWTGTGSSEQAQSPLSFSLLNGDTFDAGAWVYITGTVTSLHISVQSWNSSGAFVQQEASATIPVTSNQWNRLDVSGTTSAATAHSGRVVIQANGNQSTNARMYVGMAWANVNATDGEPRPSTLFDTEFKFTAKLQMIGGLNNSGTIMKAPNDGWSLSNSYGFGYNTLSFNFTFDGAASSVISPSVYEFDVERVYDIEFWYDWSSGNWELYRFDRSEKILIDSGSVAAKPDTPQLGSYGITLLPDCWSTFYDLKFYDPADNVVFDLSLVDSTMLVNGVTDDGTTVTSTQTAAQKNPMIVDQDMFEISRGFTGAVGFSMAKADFPTLDASGDLFVACAVQTRNDAALDIVSYHTGANGWRISSVAGTPPAQQVEFVFTEASSDISQTVATTINDGVYHFMGFQREAGVDYDLYVDDFDTPTHTLTDTHGSLNGATTLEFLTEWQGASGPLVIFQRILTDEERSELGDWLESGGQFGGAPEFISDAVFYANPSAPVQKSAINDRRLVNLAHRPESTMYLRYALTSTDGIDNPTLDLVHLEIPSVSQGHSSPWGDIFTQGSIAEHAIGPLDWQKGWLVEKPGTHNLRTRYSENEYELDGEDVTYLICFTKTTNGVTGTDPEENIVEDQYWRFFYDNNTSELAFFHNGVTVRRSQTLTVGETYLVALKILAGSIEISVNAVALTPIAENFVGIEAGGVDFGGSGNKRMHAVIHFASVFDRGLRLEEEAEILSVLESSVDFTESITISNTFDYAELNWG